MDSSTFALLPPGNPQSTVCKCMLCAVDDLPFSGGAEWLADFTVDMLAEKLADDIKKGL